MSTFEVLWNQCLVDRARPRKVQGASKVQARDHIHTCNPGKAVLLATTAGRPLTPVLNAIVDRIASDVCLAAP